MYPDAYIWSLERWYNNGETDIENRQREGRRERVRCTETVTWKLTIPYVR